MNALRLWWPCPWTRYRDIRASLGRGPPQEPMPQHDRGQSRICTTLSAKFLSQMPEA
jgi:hypothetical protein